MSLHGFHACPLQARDDKLFQFLNVGTVVLRPGPGSVGHDLLHGFYETDVEAEGILAGFVGGAGDGGEGVGGVSVVGVVGGNAAGAGDANEEDGEVVERIHGALYLYVEDEFVGQGYVRILLVLERKVRCVQYADRSRFRKSRGRRGIDGWRL